MSVALCRIGFGGFARHSGCTRRHDHRAVGMTFGNGGVNAILIISPVARDRGHRICGLLEQGANLGTVIYIMRGQRCGHDLTGIGVHAEMQLVPGPTRPGGVLLKQSLASPAQPQPCAVDQQMHRLSVIRTGVGPVLRPQHIQCCCPAAQRRVVRHPQRQAEQTNDRADQPFGLAECQAEDGTQGQRCQDRQRGIPRLAAAGGARLRCPRRDRFLGEPNGQAAALTQTGFVIRPVGHLMALSRNMVTAVLV
jgi:hypothetical protein